MPLTDVLSSAARDPYLKKFTLKIDSGDTLEEIARANNLSRNEYGFNLLLDYLVEGVQEKDIFIDSSDGSVLNSGNLTAMSTENGRIHIELNDGAATLGDYPANLTVIDIPNNHK